MSRGITPLLKSDSCLLAQYRVGRTIVRRKSTPPVSDRISSSAHSPVKLSWYHILWKPAAFTAGVRVCVWGEGGGVERVLSLAVYVLHTMGVKAI